MVSWSVAIRTGAFPRLGRSRKDVVRGGRLDPTAGVINVGVGADGGNNGKRGGLDALGLFDDAPEGKPKIGFAAGKEIHGVGVAVEGGAVGKLEIVCNPLDVLPAEESLFDHLALRMAANGAEAPVAIRGCGAVRWVRRRG